MARSRYDRDGDGMCDAPACQGVPALGTVDFVPRAEDEAFVIQRNLQRIGLHLDVHFSDRFSDAFRSGRFALAVEVQDEWDADFPNGSQFFLPLYDSSRINDPSSKDFICCNTSLVGAKRTQLRSLDLPSVDVPTVDLRIQDCQQHVGVAQTECWAELDQYLIEEVIPVVPLLYRTTLTPFSTRVAHASIDQWTAMPALDQVALKPAFT